MKMNLKNIIFILGVLFLGSSCENFLDVHPKGEVTGKELLKDRKGFENALYGVYATMRNQTLYGRYLSYYTLDVMAQYYTSFGNTYVSELRAFNYKQTDVETEFYNIWCKMYNNISNVNNILENLDNISASSLKYYPIYKGEALALRAFLHFDLLRLYGPSPAVGKEHKAIPYMEEFTNIASRRLTVNQVLEKVAADLNKARELMREVDSYGPNYADLEETYAQDKRLKNRRFHLNYYAATALLARVQLYAGNTTEALAAAREIIGTAETLPVAPFELVTEVTSADRLFQNELLFGLEMKQMKVVISDYFGEAASKANLNNNTHMLAFSVSAQNNLFAPQNPADDDYRLKIWFKETSSNVANMSNKFEGVEMMPLIRISELYYIAAECLGGKEGLAYLNKIRAYRGLKALTDDSSLQNEIY